MSNVLPSKRAFQSISLTTGATGLTGAIDLGGGTLSAIAMSTAWTSAALTFQGSYDDGTNFHDVYDKDGTEVSYTTTASRAVVFDPALWLAFTHIKIRSGTSGTAVAQAAARTLTVITQALGVIK